MKSSDNSPPIVFGRYVRGLRQAQNMSQEQLADKAGLHRTYIGMIERGEKNVTLVSILKLATALETEPSMLLTEFNS